MKPTPPTREQLVEELARRHRITKKTASELLNQVLLEVHTFVLPILEREWSGGDVIQQLHRWMGLSR